MFTLAEGFMLGCVTATYDVNEVGPNHLIKIFLSVIMRNMPFAGAGSGFKLLNDKKSRKTFAAKYHLYFLRI
jgi:hypothetical protein